jgi:hypothetical protein
MKTLRQGSVSISLSPAARSCARPRLLSGRASGDELVEPLREAVLVAQEARRYDSPARLLDQGTLHGERHNLQPHPLIRAHHLDSQPDTMVQVLGDDRLDHVKPCHAKPFRECWPARPAICLQHRPARQGHEPRRIITPGRDRAEAKPGRVAAQTQQGPRAASWATPRSQPRTKESGGQGVWSLIMTWCPDKGGVNRAPEHDLVATWSPDEQFHRVIT